MVKVITIMDDVYAELYKLKRAKNMSFTEVLRYMLSEQKEAKSSIIDLAGSINGEDIDHRAVDRMHKSTAMWR